MSTATTKITTRTIVLGKFNFCTEMPPAYELHRRWTIAEHRENERPWRAAENKSAKRTQVYVDISKLVQSSKRLI